MHRREERVETPLKPLESTDKLIHYSEFAKNILLGETLEDKLISFDLDWSGGVNFELPHLPGRERKIEFTEKQIKFPKAPNLNQDINKAIALHSFANHELLAIEMMAAALLIYPHETEDDIRFKRGVYTALKDEQKHFKLYLERIRELGHDFGDFPLNDYFWRQMPKLKTPAEYSAVMALTFEAANLDFAQYYASIFREHEDLRTAEILDIVLEDEIAHVAFGAHWMKKWRGDKSLWDYYRSCLPFPMTPARGRGIGFDPKIHERAMNDPLFIKELSHYDDDFLITKRNK